MKSMTGYGSSRFSSEDFELDVEVRSVNGRFLEVRFHIPREYLIFEVDLKKLVTQNIKRGTVDIYINRRGLKPSDSVQFVTSPHLAKSWLDACCDLSRELKIETGEMTVKDVVGSVEVIQYHHEKRFPCSIEKESLIGELKKAVEACNEERIREGKALREDLLGQLEGLRALVQSAEILRKEANAELKKRFHQRLGRLGLCDENRVDPQRLAQEIAIQLEKSDIDEEIVRLTEHVESFEKTLSDSNASGKKLDFYTQEFLREANTIGSKSHLTQLTQLIVESKTIIERMREQVQNIE